MSVKKYRPESGLGTTLPGQNAEESCSGTSETSSEGFSEEPSAEERQFFKLLEDIELTLIVEFYAHREALKKGGDPAPFRMEINFSNGWFWANIEDSGHRETSVR